MKRFDEVFSMGFPCGGTMTLRKAGLQFASYPFDRIGSPGIVPIAKVMSDFRETYVRLFGRIPLLQISRRFRMGA